MPTYPPRRHSVPQSATKWGLGRVGLSKKSMNPEEFGGADPTILEYPHSVHTHGLTPRISPLLGLWLAKHQIWPCGVIAGSF